MSHSHLTDLLLVPKTRTIKLAPNQGYLATQPYRANFANAWKNIACLNCDVASSLQSADGSEDRAANLKDAVQRTHDHDYL